MALIRFPQMVAKPSMPALGASMVMSELFGIPTRTGESLLTRTRKAVPAIPFGKVQVTEPEAVPATEPMTKGEAKEPLASESSAVKMFPGLNTPTAVNGSTTELPAHHEAGAKGSMVIWALSGAFNNRATMTWATGERMGWRLLVE